MIGEQEGSILTKVGSVGRALCGPGAHAETVSKVDTVTFKIVGAPYMTPPHVLYRGLILAHGERVKLPPKCSFTREHRHVASLLIMDCF